MLSMEEREAIRARCEAATPGPWTYDKKWNDEGNVSFDLSNNDGREHILDVSLEHGYDIYTLIENAEFIAHTRQDIPALLAALEEAENQRNIAYLVGYEDGRNGAKCDYKKL